MKSPTHATIANFTASLADLVAKNGGPSKASELIGVTRQTINLWLRGATPNPAMQVGALFLLGCPSHQLPSRTLAMPGNKQLAGIPTFQCPTPPKGKKESISVHLPDRSPVFGGSILKAKKGKK